VIGISERVSAHGLIADFIRSLAFGEQHACAKMIIGTIRDEATDDAAPHGHGFVAHAGFAGRAAKSSATVGGLRIEGWNETKI
jgi:hypothetical protein